MSNKEFKIKISNNLLQKTKYDLNIYTQKLIMLLIYKKKKEILDDKVYNYNGTFDENKIYEVLDNVMENSTILNLGELKSLFGNKKNISFREIENYFINFSGSIQWIENNQIKKIIPIGRLLNVYMETKEIEFFLNYEIKDYILSLKNKWSEIDISIYLQLSSKYQIRLYEYLCLYDCVKNNKTNFMRKRTLEDIRNFFDIPDSYQMKNIKQKVFNPAIKALNKIYAENGQKINLVCLKLDKNNPKKITHLRIDINKIKEEAKNVV